AHDPAVVDALERSVRGARADPVEPAAPVGCTRRGEGRAGDLLGVEAVGTDLRRVLADRQRARERLGRELVAPAAHVAGLAGTRLFERGVGMLLRREVHDCLLDYAIRNLLRFA